jgi:superfamily I DNA and/or RNA helicase
MILQITPYVLQVKKLRHLIDEVMPNSGLKIGSVEEFQGQERSVIILSTVRTSHHFVHSDITFGLGFLKCEKRMNVAVSRARSLLVIFGKEALLVRDEKWRSLIEITKANGTYVKNA